MNFISLSHPCIQTLKPYQAGKPIEEVQRELGIQDVVKVASNENPLGPSPLAKKAALESINKIALYPDASGYQLKHELAHFYQVSPEEITLGNGSDNILSLLIQAFGKEKAILVSEYSFDNYVLIAQGHGVDAQIAPSKNWGADVQALVNTITPQTALIFIANPNNPTGTYITHAELAFLLKNTPSHVLVVLDEAYYEYAAHLADYPKTFMLQKEYPNLIITRTFSKGYGLAGLRVGYSISHPQIADVLNRIRLPFNASTPAMAAASAALHDKQHLEETLALNHRGMAYLKAECDKLGLFTIPSATNFITVDMREDSAPLFQKLLRMGIIVRPLHTYKMPHHLRITIGLDEQNKRVVDALKTLVRK
jgi:histidinol-phosphate aminotransferase